MLGVGTRTKRSRELQTVRPEQTGHMTKIRKAFVDPSGPIEFASSICFTEMSRSRQLVYESTVQERHLQCKSVYQPSESPSNTCYPRLYEPRLYVKYNILLMTKTTKHWIQICFVKGAEKGKYVNNLSLMNPKTGKDGALPTVLAELKAGIVWPQGKPQQ